jgi:hypothetical protein
MMPMSPADWTAVGACTTAIVALATLFLAWKTRSMATATEKMVGKTKDVADATLKEAKAVEQQVTVSSLALTASVQPWLAWLPGFKIEPTAVRTPTPNVRLPDDWYEGFVLEEIDDGVSGRLLVRNVGNGLALLDISASRVFRQGGPHPLEGQCLQTDSPVIAPGDHTTVLLRVHGLYAANHVKMSLDELTGGPAPMHRLDIELTYTDLVGGSPTVARFKMAPRTSQPQRWWVFETSYQREGLTPITVRSV